MNKKMLAVIPARGGSKGVPGKNIKLLNGKPLILWTIEAAKKAANIGRIVLSTDDEGIAKVCEPSGIEIPFLRPKELAQDNSMAIDNYIYTVDRLNRDSDNLYNDFVVLQPTSPLRMSSDIDEAIELFFKKKADSVVSVSEATHPPAWNKKVTKNGKLENYFSICDENKNRQEFEVAYIPNGAIFVFSLSLLKSKYSYISDETYAYIMPKSRSIDIDTELDFQFAEFLMQQKFERATHTKS